jgi:hypothetical protein
MISDRYNITLLTSIKGMIAHNEELTVLLYHTVPGFPTGDKMDRPEYFNKKKPVPSSAYAKGQQYVCQSFEGENLSKEASTKIVS